MHYLRHLKDNSIFSQTTPEKLESAVALIFRENPENSLEILFVKRSSSQKDKHSGQIAFPGGKLEKNENSLEAALRETYEEIGVKLNSSEYLGHFGAKPAYQGGLRISNMLLTSHLFFTAQKLEISLNLNEISSYRWVPFNLFTHYLPSYFKPKKNSMTHINFKTLLNPSSKISGEFPGVLLEKSQFCDSPDYSEYHLWGATFRIVREVVKVLPKNCKSVSDYDWVYYNLDWPHKVLNPYISYIDTYYPELLTYKSFLI